MNQLSSITPLEIILIALAAVGIFFFFRACWRNIKRSRQHLSVALLTLVMTLTVQTAWAWNGDGTEASPYQISTVADLVQLATDVNSGTTYEGFVFKLMNNIDFNDDASLKPTKAWDDDTSTEQNFPGIGGRNTAERTFNGTFNGNYKTISGIRIYSGGTENSDKQRGLFGLIGSKGTVKNLTFSNARITGYTYTGGIAGKNFGMIDNCHVTNTVCIHTVNSNKSYDYHGGVAGDNSNGIISNCTSSAKLTVKEGVTAEYGYGGIVGRNWNSSARLSNNFVYGATIPAAHGNKHGAIAGRNEATMTNNYYTGCTVAGTENASNVGCMGADVTTDNGAICVFVLALGTNVTASGSTVEYNSTTYYYGTVTLGYSGTVSTGGIVKYAVNGDYISGNEFTISGDADVTAVVVYPYADISGLTYHGSTFDILGNTYVTSGSYYEINDEQDLINLANYVNAGNNCAGLTFKLTRDLDFSGLPDNSECKDNNGRGNGNFLPIGINAKFAGSFYGQGHSITGLRFDYNSSSGVGLFANITNATVDGVTVVSPTINGFNKVGGIVGIMNGGNVSNCAVVGGTIGQSNAGWRGGIVGYTPTSGTNTISGCTVVGTNISRSNTAAVNVGIIVGYNSSNTLTISNCTYHNPDNLNILDNGTYTNGGGNQRVYQLTLVEDVTASGATYSHVLVPNKAYYAENTTVTLGHNREGGIFLGYQSDDVTISNGTFTMPASDVSINANWADPNDISVNAAGDEYTIKTAAGWNVFCDLLEGGTSFTGKTVYLDKDISVTRMAGSSSHKFTGTFDGQGNVLTVSYGTEGTPINEQYAAPFSYVDGATIQNLSINGDIYTSAKYAAGIVSSQYGTVSISNCRVSINIHCSISGDGTHAGFVALNNNDATLNIEGCVFSGKLLTTNGTYRCAGYVGWRSGTVNISNSLYAPVTPDDGETWAGTSESATFVRNGGTSITNSYYTADFNDDSKFTAQGKQARSITAGENVTVANAGNATEYTVSDITAYGTGIKYGGVLYAGADEEVSLTLSHTDRDNYAFNGYTASTCTLSGSDNPYTLTMPNADVTITGNYLSTLTSGTCGKTSSDNVTWELTGDADHYTLTISGTGDMADYTLVKQQPWRYYASSITSVVVENGVMSIGENAFNGCKLSSITLPEGLTTINAAAFADNGTTIESVSIPQSVTSIGDHAFDGTSVTHFYINNIPSKIAISANTPFVASGTTFHVFTQMQDVFANATNWSNYAGHFLADVDITHVTSVTLDNERMIVKTLASGKLNATINPADARVKDVMFTSSNDMIFHITDAATGEFQAGSIEGEAAITCTAMDGSGEYATCVVRVDKNLIPAESVTLNKSEKSMNVGETFKLTATVNPGNATHKNCTWRSSDENVATVSSNGTVAAVAAGVATITAISGDGNARANCVLTVKAPVTTSYVDADGTLHENVTAMPLDNSMTTLAAGWYVVNEDVTFTSKITLDGDVNLILGDGKTMTVTNTGTDHEDRAIYGNEKTLHIYGQSQGTGALTAAAVGGDAAICLVINQKATSMLGIHGGVVSASTEYASGNGILVQCETDAGGIVIDGGQVTASGKKYGIYCEGGHFDILGGQVTATGTNGYGLVICDCSLNPGVLTLGYSKATDFVSTNSIYNYSGESFVGEVKIADDQTLVDGNGNIWSGTLSNDEIQSIRNQTLRPVTGVALTKDGSGNISATFDGTLLETVNIPVGVTVNSVTLNRTFTPGKASTVMLPFDYTCTGNEGGTFYKFVSMEKENDQWVATMKATGDDTNNVGTLTKNTPYLFLPTATGIAFTIPNEGVTLCTEGGGNCQTADAGSHWTFKGTNSYIKWTSNTADADYTQERADEIGKVYGFAGVQKDGIDVGDFVKAKSGAKIRPMTCYLIWNSTPNNTRGMTRGTIDELPSSIVVRLLSSVGPGNQGNDDNQGNDNGNQGGDDNGETTAIGTLDTESGEIDFGDWYDMSGHKLSAKPTKKGLYIHNGSKIVIK